MYTTGRLLPMILSAAVALVVADSGYAQQPAKAGADPFVSPGVAHPATDQPFWVPTLAQAEEMARVTGRPIYVIGTVCDYWDGY